MERKVWLIGQAVKTPPSHGGNRGSIPLLAVIRKHPYSPVSADVFHCARIDKTALTEAYKTALTEVYKTVLTETYKRTILTKKQPMLK